MSKLLENFNSSVDLIKTEIETYPLTASKGTKKMLRDYNINAKTKRNEYVTEIQKLFTIDLDNIRLILNDRKQKLLPVEKITDIEINKNQLKLLKKALKYNDKYNDYYDKTKLEGTIYNIDDIENSNLNEINNITLYLVNIFTKAGVKLTEKDFNYSVYTKTYMTTFLENMNNENFDSVMEQIFNKIYWNCPSLLTHLKLNIRSLVTKYKKPLSRFCNDKKNNIFKKANVTEKNYVDEYNRLYKSITSDTLNDDYINIMKFINKELNVNDYVKDSSFRKAKFNKFLGEVDFDNLDQETKEKYYLELINLKRSIEEVENYYLFKDIITDVITRYNNKDQNKGVYKNKFKEIKKAQKIKDKKIKKYYKLLKRNKGNRFNSLLNEITVQINEQIKILNTLYGELEDARINDKISDMINKGSTIYDAMFLIGSFYGYLKKLIITKLKPTSMEEVNELMRRFDSFASNSYNLIIRFTNLFEDINLEEMINNKCKLLNIHIEGNVLENVETIKQELEFIQNVYYIEKNNISFDDIKFICDVNELV